MDTHHTFKVLSFECESSTKQQCEREARQKARTPIFTEREIIHQMITTIGFLEPFFKVLTVFLLCCANNHSFLIVEPSRFSSWACQIRLLCGANLLLFSNQFIVVVVA